MLENRVRQYTSPYCDVIRAKIVLLAAEGLSNDVIATRLDTPRQIVSKWRKRFALARLPGLEANRLRHLLTIRSEEHTSELQSRGHLVCRLLLEKKKKKSTTQIPTLIENTTT